MNPVTYGSCGWTRRDKVEALLKLGYTPGPLPLANLPAPPEPAARPSPPHVPSTSAHGSGDGPSAAAYLECQAGGDAAGQGSSLLAARLAWLQSRGFAVGWATARAVVCCADDPVALGWALAAAGPTASDAELQVVKAIAYRMSVAQTHTTQRATRSFGVWTRQRPAPCTCGPEALELLGRAPQVP